MFFEQIKKNLSLVFILPSTHCILLQIGGPAMHSLVDFLFVIWDFFVYIGVGALIIGLACGVIFSHNPIRSLFSLIGVFLSAIFLFLSIRVEFLSMIFLIVYVGAIAILFLFVIMLLNLKKAMPASSSHPTNLLTKWGIPLPLFMISLLTFLSFSNIFALPTYYNTQTLKQGSYLGLEELNHLNHYFRFGFSDAAIFSELFYSVYGSLFLGLAGILAVSMIGSIVLALSTSESTESQNTNKHDINYTGTKFKFFKQFLVKLSIPLLLTYQEFGDNFLNETKNSDASIYSKFIKLWPELEFISMEEKSPMNYRLLTENDRVLIRHYGPDFFEKVYVLPVELDLNRRAELLAKRLQKIEQMSSMLDEKIIHHQVGWFFFGFLGFVVGVLVIEVFVDPYPRLSSPVTPGIPPSPEPPDLNLD